MEIAKSRALVTGGASGLGLATVAALVKSGARVVAIDLASADTAALAALGDAVEFVPADVTDEDAVTKAVEIANVDNTLRIAVNCAGIGSGIKTISSNGPFPLDAFEKVVKVNLIGTFNVLRLAAYAMSQNSPVDGERGVVINTASGAAYDGQIGQAAYSSSKGGVVGMTLPVARDLARSGIRVCTIAPGIFWTPMLAGMPQDVQDSLGAAVPFPPRLGRPDEYAALAMQIVSNQMLNGETIRLDGAIRMAPK